MSTDHSASNSNQDHRKPKSPDFSGINSDLPRDNEAKDVNLPKLRWESTGKGDEPNKVIRRRMSAANRTAQRESDMSIEEITDFLESVSLD